MVVVVVVGGLILLLGKVKAYSYTWVKGRRWGGEPLCAWVCPDASTPGCSVILNFQSAPIHPASPSP